MGTLYFLLSTKYPHCILKRKSKEYLLGVLIQLLYSRKNKGEQVLKYFLLQEKDSFSAVSETINSLKI